MFKRKIAKCTPDQQARQDKARAMGCIACIIRGERMEIKLHQCGASEIHHQTTCGRQTGQDQTICLGQWHHRAICREGFSTTIMKDLYGPSLATGSRTFHEYFGSDAEQLRYQNALLQNV